MLHLSSYARSVGLLAFGCAVLVLLGRLLAADGDASYSPIPRPASRAPVAYVTSTEPAHATTTRTLPATAATAVAAPPPPEEKKQGNILVILPKDHRTKGDFGFRDGGWLDLAIQNRKDYANLHGYEFVWEDLSKYKREYAIDACWAKIAALQHSFDTYPDVEWLWMLDSDAIIMNPNIDLHEHLLSDEALKKAVRPNFEIQIPGGAKIEDDNKSVRTPSEVIPDEIYLVIAADGNGLNAGSFFIRRTPFMAAMINFWRDPYLMHAGFGYREQDALAHLILSHDHLLKHVAVVHQKLINEYVDRLQPNDFVVHFAGCSFYKDRDCDKLFKEHWEKAQKPGEAKQITKQKGELKPSTV